MTDNSIAIAQATVDKAIKAIETLRTEREDLVLLVDYMAENDWPAKDIAYAVEKPHKYLNVLAEAQAALEVQA